MPRKTAEERMDDRIAFGRRVRAARLKAGHETVREASEATGIDKTSLVRFECGAHSPSVDMIATLVTIGGYEPRVLFPGKANRVIVPVNASPLDESVSR